MHIKNGQDAMKRKCIKTYAFVFPGPTPYSKTFLSYELLRHCQGWAIFKRRKLQNLRFNSPFPFTH